MKKTETKKKNTPLKIVVEPKKVKTFGHLMLDLETMGTKSNSVICSIGAVEFNMNTGETGKEFFQTIKIQSSLQAGLTIDGSTLNWWLQQDRKAREAILTDTKGLSEVLYQFRLFLESIGTEDLQIWGNSARFDLGLLENAYDKLYPGKQPPWAFWNERDVRTLVSFNPKIKLNMPFDGVLHNPIDDAKHQIKYCSAIWNLIVNSKSNSEVLSKM